MALQRFPRESFPWRDSGSLRMDAHLPDERRAYQISELPRLAPLRTAKDYDDFLARLAAYPRQIDQVIELMKRGMAAGWVPPAVPIGKVLPQIEKQWVDDVDRARSIKPFESFPEAIAPGRPPRGWRPGRAKRSGLDHPRAQAAASVHRRRPTSPPAGKRSPHRACRADPPTIRRRSAG